MRVVIDTNVLMRGIEYGHAQQPVADAAVVALLGRGDELCITPQTLYEFWSVTTRPTSQNGLGLTPARVAGELTRIKMVFVLLPELPAILGEWERLVVAHSVLGKNSHDAHLAAAAIVHGATHILTFNVRHFARFPGITILDPTALAAVGP